MTDPNTELIPSGEQPHHSDWPKMLEWVEEQAQESLKARYATSEIIAKEVQTTLTVLLAGVGGSGAYAAKFLEPGSAGPATIAFAVVCFYLTVVSAALVLKCMWLRKFPALYQDPMNLMHPTFALDAVREVEIRNLGKRIEEASGLNGSRARWLNFFRLLAVFSPIVFALAAHVATSKYSNLCL